VSVKITQMAIGFARQDRLPEDGEGCEDDSLEKKGLLRSKQQLVNGKVRRVYAATASGRKALRAAKQRVRELFGELFEHDEGTRES
jgi:hypothetical protein